MMGAPPCGLAPPSRRSVWMVCSSHNLCTATHYMRHLSLLARTGHLGGHRNLLRTYRRVPSRPPEIRKRASGLHSAELTTEVCPDTERTKSSPLELSVPRSLPAVNDLSARRRIASTRFHSFMEEPRFVKQMSHLPSGEKRRCLTCFSWTAAALTSTSSHSG